MPKLDVGELHRRQTRAEQTARELLDPTLVGFGQLDARHGRGSYTGQRLAAQVCKNAIVTVAALFPAS